MRILVLFSIVISSFQLVAQDTTWVQTFTYDSISTRRAVFDFPAELNDMRFEKVLMYYNLKCSPQTPWDQYNCGEWDYLAYTRIFDHTGVYDSIQVDSVRFLHDYQSSPTFDYEPWGYNYTNSYQILEHERSGATTTLFPVSGAASGSANYPYDLNNKGGRFQMLVTQAELIAAGVVPGDIQSLGLFINNITNGGELMHPRILIKSTTDASISSFHESGFTEVYALSHSGGVAPVLVTGENELLFYQPFNWNGTDNLIVEFSFDNGVQPQNLIDFDTETSVAGMAVNYASRNGVLNFTGSEYALTELSDFDLGNELTIAFWAKGTANTGVNTSVLEGYDTLNNRVINIHMPWSNNRIYWDCGAGSGYDRIDQDMSSAGIDNEWHHWAFTKNQGTGIMNIYRDGVLWHTGSGLTRSIGELHRLVIGANRSLGNNWNGKIDEFQIYNVEVDAATIATWYDKKIDASHPFWNDLLVYYNFDNEEFAQDMSQNDYLLMPSTKGLFDFSEYPVAGVNIDMNRPVFSLGNGTVTGAIQDVTVAWSETVEPEVVFEFQQVDHHFEIVNAFVAAPAGNEVDYDLGGVEISSVPYLTGYVLNNEAITYFQEPYEIIHDVEIGRYITPYGIGFDLGPNGFTWIYDVTDYQMYLHDAVDLAAHNTQELIDLKFAFIEGIPPRDVHRRDPIWSDWRSYSYSSLDNNTNLSETDFVLSDTSSMFKIKTRLTGHGQQGNGSCCEWSNKHHQIIVDGTELFDWEIWEETFCGDNPLTEQGGTWPYAREGWCPGAMVKEYDHELTSYVTPGDTVTFDYTIDPVPGADQAQGNGNFVVAMDLISYSAPNHQYDMAIHDVLNPNDYEFYRKWNPGCQNPRVIIQNRGEQPITECEIRVYISASNPLVYKWTGNLEFLEKEIVEIPIPSVDWWYNLSPNLTFTARIMSVNGDSNLDEYSQNDAMVIPFTAPDYISGPFLVWFQSNNKPWENKWRLEDAAGNIIYEQTNITASTTYKDTFDLAVGCYSIIIEDNDSDGLGYWYSNQVEGETNGLFRVKLVGGGYMEYFPTDFGNYHRYNFSVGYQVGMNEKFIQHEIMMFPNPAQDMIQIELSGIVNGKAQMEIYDLMGKKVHGEHMNAEDYFANSIVDLSGFKPGQYVVKIVTGDRVYVNNFIKN